MKVVIQRVSEASVEIEGLIHGSIKHGILLLLGIVDDDDQSDIDWMVRKILNLRIFDDAMGVMNRSLIDVEGNILIISQFTLHASTKKGNRPSYLAAAKPEISEPLYERFVKICENELGLQIQTGIFGADMKVSLINDGPVTLIIDSKDKK